MVATLAMAGCLGGDGSSTGPEGEAPLPAYVPTPAMDPPAARALSPRRLRRLTNAEMENVYADLLGGERLPLARGFLPDPVSEGFDNDAVLLGMGTSKLEEVITAAERVATALVAPGALERQAPCPAGADVRGCARSFASRVAGVAWGRPPTAEEMGRLEQVFMTGAAESEASASYAGGISLTTEAMLSSPHFVYRSELGQLPTDPRRHRGHAGRAGDRLGDLVPVPRGAPRPAAAGGGAGRFAGRSRDRGRHTPRAWWPRPRGGAGSSGSSGPGWG